MTAQKVKKIIEVLKDAMIVSSKQMDGFVFLKTGYERSPVPPPCTAAWENFSKDARVSGRDSHYWFRKCFRTPRAAKGRQIVFRLLTGREGQWDALNPQGLAFLNHEMIQGLDVNHTDLLLEPETDYELDIYFYLGMFYEPVEFRPYLLELDRKVEQLFYDLSVPYDSCCCFGEHDIRYLKTMKALHHAVNLLDLREPYSLSFYEQIEQAAAYMKESYYLGTCGQDEAVVWCTGHTHIDVAWLWTLEQTREKVQRSFATVQNLMKQYPEYCFLSSQPQLLAYVKEDAPVLYEGIKQAVSEGRWEMEGAMWLEADCNLTSGESLIRQIIVGKCFMKEEFGVDNKVLWLPDVFGYSAALPQILSKCGVEVFVTSKISWNETNRMPFDSFFWEGVDGTELFTYFLTAQDLHKFGDIPKNKTIYEGTIRPSQILGTWERYEPKEYNHEVLLSYGFGDGGGGPNKDMLEQQRRLAFGIPGIPKTKMGAAGPFLTKLLEKFQILKKEQVDCPRWVGELYLEFHRGTYTSMGKNKRNNRKAEFLLQGIEALASIAMCLTGKDYPRAVLLENWKTVLLNQFHDIIPGSSIREVYEESDLQYAKVFEEGKKLKDHLLSGLAGEAGSAGGLFVYNPHSMTMSDNVLIGGKCVYAKEIPAFGWKVINPSESVCKVKVSKDSIENQYFILQLNENGEISSLWDKEYGRELIAEGRCGNQFQVFEDLPYQYDAWELSSYHKEKMWIVDELLSAEILIEGARAGLLLRKRYQKSQFVQSVFLYENSRRIDFVTEVDWHEDHVILKTAFPLAVHSDFATYEIQFGNLKRPTHANTSWDAAKFEVCAQKWADLSEEDYGVSLLNDCKYGYSISGNVMYLSLLKAATYPYPEADRGKHSFVYALYPHAGNAYSGGTVWEAYKLNRPMFAKWIPKQAGSLPERYSFLSCDQEDVVIETVKLAEQGDDLILRLYEAHNKRCLAKINLGFKAFEAILCDMLEQEISPLDLQNGVILVPIKPFEIITIKIKQARPAHVKQHG